MNSLPLSLGPLKAEGFAVRRSGIHWLCSDGHLCRPGEVIGFCNISLERTSGKHTGSFPFSDELELQVAFAPRSAGRLRIAKGNSPGGYLNFFGVQVWDPSVILGYLDPACDDESAEGNGELRLLMLAGRRMSGLADVDFGVLPGWHSRSRAWWCDQNDNVSTLLCLGICDAAGVVRGNKTPFVEIFEASPLSAQIVFVPDHPVLPCAPVLLEQFLRTPAQNAAIAADLSVGLSSGRSVPTADDWLFAGAFLSSLEHSPIREKHDVLTPLGLRQLDSADAILLSLNAESQSIMRHKKLGYSIQMLRHHQAAAGPAIRSWLASSFETVKRSVEDIRLDYLRLFDTVRAQTGARFLVLNRMSTSGYEDILSYAPFDAPMSDTLANVASKELNLMLHDLADECDFSIIDVDAIAADLGGSNHLPDGIHQSGTMQSMVRAEVLRILHGLQPRSTTSSPVR
jgi:hypothetical protein